MSGYKVRPQRLIPYYSANAVAPTRDTRETVDRMTRYLERIFSDTSARLTGRMADRVADRVAEKMTGLIADMDARIATLEVLADEEALDDLRASSRDSDSDLRDYDEIRREAGLA